MAETNNKKKSTAPKKNTSAASNTKKQTSQKKPNNSKANQTKKQQSEAAERNTARKQVISSVMFAVGLFLLFVIIVPSGVAEGETNLWQGMKDIFFGLFGVCAFAVPVLLFYTAYVLAKDKPLGSLAMRIGGITSATVCLSSVIHAASNSADYLSHTSFSEQIKSAWAEGLSLTNGGAAGAIFGGAIAKLFGKTGGLITVIIILLALVMLLTGTTVPKLIELIRKPLSRATDYTQQKIEQKRYEEVVPAEEKPKKTKKNEDYQLPKPEKTLKRPKLGSGFFSDDYDPVPNKEDEPVEYVEQPEPEKTAEIPVFSPMPSGVDLSVDVDDEPQKTQPEADEPVYEDIPISKNPIPAQEVVDLIEKASLEAEKDVHEQQSIIPDEEDEGDEPEHVYVLPDVECLAENRSFGDADVKEELTANANKLVETLKSFNVETKIVDIVRGPSVTRYEIQPAPGVKISRITGLADDLAMN
ncbi:MAG: DNA translocase FtsK 4TM domain-containing protein, partial [Clostridia bacterium]|nr:DNA translocase FtsK 4TM domain-containing protein [Clostridia bacterium]